MDVMIQTAFLVIAILAVQKLFGNKLHAYVRYSLWMLVVVRLIIPVNFIDSPFSMLRFAEAIQLSDMVWKGIDLQGADAARQADAVNGQEASLKDILQPAGAGIDTENFSSTKNTENTASDTAEIGAGDSRQTDNALRADGAALKENDAVQRMDMKLLQSAVTEAYLSGRINRVWYGIWLTGSLLVGGFLGFSHFRFRRRLRRTGVVYKKGLPNIVKKTRVTVYRVKGLETPCLVGLVHPSIYIGTDIDTASDYFRYAVTHEGVHYLHQDHVWAFVRAVLITVYWFNPFVWAAALLSLRDGEIACDYGTVQRLGKEEQLAYGEMLLTLSGVKRRKRVYSYGIMLRPRRSELKERILRLTQKDSSRVWAGVLAAFIMIMMAGCAFTGASEVSGGKTFLMVNEAGKDATDTVSDENIDVTDGEGTEIPGETSSEAVETQPDYPARIEPKPAEVSGGTPLGVDGPQLDYAGFPYSSPYDIHNMVEIIYDEPCVYNRVSDAFGERIHPVTGEVRVHDGIDYAAAEGTSIVAAADGEVYETGYSAEHGNYVVLLHINGDMTYYCHCREIVAKEGGQVKRGDRIATVGKTGQATGSHLHFALSRDGEFINPQEHMRAE